MGRVDAVLAQIKFPLDFQRQLPSLDNLKFYKASEFKNLLLYGLIPSTKDQLLQRAKAEPAAGDFLHWIVLYHEIVARLNSDSIVKTTLAFVDQLVRVWQQLLPEYLGENGQTFNAHATAHLVHFVRLLGPLHNFSAFPFESFMGEYVRLVTSSNGMIEQVARRVLHEKFMRRWVKCAKKSSNVSLRFIAGKVFKKFAVGHAVCLTEDLKLLAEPKNVTLTDDELEALQLSFCDFSGSEILSVSRVKVRSITVSSEANEIKSNRCTHIGKFRDFTSFSYASIVRIVIWNGIAYGICKKFVVEGNIMDDVPLPCNNLLQDLWNENEYRPYGNFFHLVRSSSMMCVFPMSDFLRRCIVVPANDGCSVCYRRTDAIRT